MCVSQAQVWRLGYRLSWHGGPESTRDYQSQRWRFKWGALLCKVVKARTVERNKRSIQMSFRRNHLVHNSWTGSIYPSAPFWSYPDKTEIWGVQYVTQGGHMQESDSGTESWDIRRHLPIKRQQKPGRASQTNRRPSAKVQKLQNISSGSHLGSFIWSPRYFCITGAIIPLSE